MPETIYRCEYCAMIYDCRQCCEEHEAQCYLNPDIKTSGKIYNNRKLKKCTHKKGE